MTGEFFRGFGILYVGVGVLGDAIFSFKDVAGMADYEPAAVFACVAIGATSYFIGDRMDAREKRAEELELRREQNLYLSELKETGNHLEDTVERVLDEGLPVYKVETPVPHDLLQGPDHV